VTGRGEPSWQPISMLATIAELAGELGRGTIERRIPNSDIELGPGRRRWLGHC